MTTKMKRGVVLCAALACLVPALAGCHKDEDAPPPAGPRPASQGPGPVVGGGPTALPSTAPAAPAGAGPSAAPSAARSGGGAAPSSGASSAL